MKLRRLTGKRKRIRCILFLILLLTSIVLFIRSSYFFESPIIMSVFYKQAKNLSSEACSMRQCTLDESRKNGEQFASFSSDWSSCYSDIYLLAFDYDDRDTYTLIDVGSNKAYVVAAWLAFFLPELNVNRANLHDYLESTKQVGYACGSCQDCKAQSFKQSNIRPKLRLHMHAFEPQPSTIDLLKNVQTWMNVSTKSQSTFDVYGMAISNFIGQTAFKRCSIGNEVCSLDVSNTGYHQQVQVDVITLDRFADRNDLFTIDILKIDTEGYEPYVFQGFQKLLKNHRIRLFIFEHLNTGVWHTTSLPMEISKFAKLGYSCYIIGKTGLLLVTNCWNNKLNVSHSNILCVSSKDRRLWHNVNRLTLMGSVLPECEFEY